MQQNNRPHLDPKRLSASVRSGDREMSNDKMHGKSFHPLRHTTYAGFQIHCEPIRYVNFLIIFRELGLEIDGAQIFDFHHLEDVVNGDIFVGVFGQNATLIVEDGVFFDRCSAFYARQFGFFAATIGGGTAVIIIVVVIVVDAVVVIRRNSVSHNAKTVSIVSGQFPAFDI